MFLAAVAKAALLFLNLKFTAGILVSLFVFFVVSLVIHWPEEKKSYILRVFYTVLMQMFFTSFFIIIFFPYFFGQQSLSPLPDAARLFFTLGERILLSGFVVFLIFFIPVVAKVFMDLTGLQFYIMSLFIFHSCAEYSNKIAIGSGKAAVVNIYEYFGFFFIAIVITIILYYTVKFLTRLLPASIGESITRTACMLGGILAFLYYTQYYFLSILSIAS